MAEFTILLPHKKNKGNDAALAICLSCLMDNTDHDFHLLIDAAVDQPLYPRVNALFEQAKTDRCIYWSSDIWAAPHFDTPLLEMWNKDTIVTGIVVEPGAIGVHANNITRDFGRRPETFRRAEFEAYTQSDEANIPGGIGFIAPYLCSRERWLEHGGLELGLPGDHNGFTNADSELFARMIASGMNIVRAKSFFYHAQRYSEPSEQTDPKRDIQVES